ncbi:ABC transporter permease [Rhodohalobacter sp. SW132]|uniref:ABC transporter permease n=1 Tax=Rhodohalobacter sp. SW132 TaxID=2293433 RepID=UPI000E24175C|nr:ABC transporter permease [Rhodohalobacter sp. SW132]REL38174.1 ABC transporter permease [Rhodohalobacter sp. SW132]
MSWRQVFLVLKREYLTRVKSKGFIAATLLVPIGIIAIYGIGFLVIIWDSEVSYEVGIHDNSGAVVQSLVERDPQRYLDVSDVEIDTLRAMTQRGEITGYVQIDERNIEENIPLELIYTGSGGLTLLSSVRSDLRDVIREEKLLRAEVSDEIQQIFASRIGVESRRLTDAGEEQDDDTAFLSGVGFAMGFIIFIAIFSYGGYIMRGVIEEKSNRIIEVITSSVKPIELLTGKMLGVGALALTQIGIWGITIVGLGLLAAPLLSMFLANGGDAEQAMGEVAAQTDIPILTSIPTIETSLIVFFIVFFFLGYFLYSSLFAAVGSAADSETDTQQLMLPIMAPIFIAYFIMFQAVKNPDGIISVVGSLVPFFAPIVMITRIAISDVPFWELSLSIILMIVTFIGTMWLSAKIYKVGILSYGSSAGFKDILKWIRQ